MHTPEQAKVLWCPMARVAQFGSVDTHTSYNRSLTKEPVRVMVAQAAAKNFQLGESPEIREAVMLKFEENASRAASCIADKCAMWRTVVPPAHISDNRGYCGLAPLHGSQS